MNAFPTPEEQYAEAARWSSLLCSAGYITELHGTGEPAPFNREWRVFASWNGPQIATIDIDGCGASWHGPDDLWLKVIGPSQDLMDEDVYQAGIAYGARTASEAVEALRMQSMGLGY